MKTKSRATIVHKATNDISKKLEVLVDYGVISFEDAIDILTTLNIKQVEWVGKNLNSIDVIEFIRSMEE